MQQINGMNAKASPGHKKEARLCESDLYLLVCRSFCEGRLTKEQMQAITGGIGNATHDNRWPTG